MYKILFTFFIVFFSFSRVFCQCLPNPIFTISPLPGVYPPNIPIPGISLFGIEDGQQNVQYQQDLTLIILEDTTLDIGFLLPNSVVTAMNTAGISTVMNVDVNYVYFDIVGLPANFSYLCNINNCEYPSGINGCISISGIPNQNGTYPIDINMMINIEIPQITVPVIGTVLYNGGGQNLPSFTAQQYNLFIDAPSNTITNSKNRNVIYPNPTNNISTLYLNLLSDLEVFNILGEKIKTYNNVNNSINFRKSELGSGLFFIKIYSEQGFMIKNLIIN